MKVLKVLGVIVVALIALDRLVMCGAGPDGMNYQRAAQWFRCGMRRVMRSRARHPCRATRGLSTARLRRPMEGCQMAQAGIPPARQASPKVVNPTARFRSAGILARSLEEQFAAPGPLEGLASSNQTRAGDVAGVLPERARRRREQAENGGYNAYR